MSELYTWRLRNSLIHLDKHTQHYDTLFRLQWGLVHIHKEEILRSAKKPRCTVKPTGECKNQQELKKPCVLHNSDKTDLQQVVYAL